MDPAAKKKDTEEENKVFCLFPFHCFFLLRFYTDNYPESDNIQRLYSECTSSNAERHQFTSNFAGITFSVTESKCELSNAFLFIPSATPNRGGINFHFLSVIVSAVFAEAA
jgi:hypothetical protein